MNPSRIFDAFPTPKFLDIPYVGLSISDSAVRCIQFGKKRGKLYIEKYAEKIVPPGVVSGGQVNNKEEMVNILQSLKKDLNLNYVKISLPEEKAYLFTAKIPMVKENEVRSAIESKIEENVPVPPGELTFDYKITPHREKNHLDVVVSNLQISLVDSYVEIGEKAGLSLLSMEIESQAITRALLPENSLGTVLIVHFGKEKVGLYVSNDRIVHFTSTIQTKGESLNNPDFLLQEIKRLYMYWHTLKDNVDEPDRKIGKIIICGENFQDSIVQYISSHIESNVSLGNVWTNVFNISTDIPEISFNDSLKYAAAIGLALPSDTLM